MDNQELLIAIREIVREELKPVKTDVSGLKEDVSGLKEDMNYMKITLKEQGQILNALEHKLDVVKVEQENMKYDVNKLVGKVEGMENILSIVEAATAHNWNEIVKLKSVK